LFICRTHRNGIGYCCSPEGFFCTSTKKMLLLLECVSGFRLKYIRGIVTMSSTQFPNIENQQLTLNRLKYHAEQHYVGQRGVQEIRGYFRNQYLFLEAVMADQGMVGRFFRKATLKRGVGKLARLEYEGPNKWKFLIYKFDVEKYGPHPQFQEGTIEECLDIAARVYITG